MPTQALGWFKKPISKTEDLTGLKFRTDGQASDMLTAIGRGLLDGAEFNNQFRSCAV